MNEGLSEDSRRSKARPNSRSSFSILLHHAFVQDRCNASRDQRRNWVDGEDAEYNYLPEVRTVRDLNDLDSLAALGSRCLR